MNSMSEKLCRCNEARISPVATSENESDDRSYLSYVTPPQTTLLAIEDTPQEIDQAETPSLSQTAVDVAMSGYEEERDEESACSCPPPQEVQSKVGSQTLPELSEGSTANESEAEEGIQATFRVAVSHRVCWVDKVMLRPLSLTCGNHHYDPSFCLRHHTRTVPYKPYHLHSGDNTPYKLGSCSSQGLDLNFCRSFKGLTHFGCCITRTTRCHNLIQG